MTTDVSSANSQYLANKAAGTLPPATSAAAAAGASVTGDFNFFLTMLTTQLKNQDPTAPMDVNQMTQQIAEFSGVQQQVQTNANLETLINAGKQSQLSTAVSYIGKEVDTKGNSSSMVGSEAAFSYTLPSAATNSTITITNAAGNAVFTGKATGLAGGNLVLWDGTNSTTGATEPDGVYTFAIAATDSSGNPVTATTASTGTVDSVQTDASGNTILMSGTQQFKFSDIIAVRGAPPPLSSQASSGSGSGT